MKLMNKMKRAIRRVTMATLAGTMCLGAAGSVSAATCDAKDELVIGDHQPLSGSLAGLGVQVHRGVELAVKHYNEGTHPLNPTPCLEVGGKKYKLTEVVYDNKVTAEGGIAAAKRLVFEDGVKFVVGSVGSGPSMASSEAVFEPNQVIFMSTGWNPAVIGEKKPYTFRTGATSREYGIAFWQWATTGGLPDLKKMGLLTQDNEAGRGGGKAYIEVVKSFGIETTNIEFWPVGTTDFYPYLTRLMAQEPDLIDISSSPVEEGLQAKQLRELGYEGYVRGLCNSPEVTIETAGGPEAVEGLFCIYAVDWDGGPPLITEQMARFRDEYRADYPGDEPGTQSLYVYDAAVGLLEAMKMAGTVEDSTKVRDVLEKFNWMLSTGYMSSWGGMESYGRNHQLVHPIPIPQMQNGKAIIIGMPIVPVP
jgi:branched-chain amino acid transport system substrate-binding protein